MEFDLAGWPEDGPTLRLDHRRFAYAGKFVTSNTGKVVAREDSRGEGADASEDGEVVGAVAFNADRTDPETACLRYVTVRDDYRGHGVGPRLCAFAVERLAERGYERVRIAVNNPFAYEALHKVGFAWTGEETGLAELVLERPAEDVVSESVREERYQEGLDAYRGRDGLSDEEQEFLDEKDGAGPPECVTELRR